MSEPPTPPTTNPEHQDQPPSSGAGRTPTGRPQEAIDTAEAARMAGAAIGMGREGLRAAWKKGKEAAAARGVTEESVRQTFERGRVIAAERARALAAEQARRRGSGRSETPQWPGGLSDRRDDVPPAGSTTGDRLASERSTAARPTGDRRAAAPASEPASTTRSATRTVAKAVLARGPALAGRRLLGVFPSAATGSAPIERRLGAFALDLVVFALGFFVLLLAGDVLFGAALGGGSGDDWLGLSFEDVIRVVTLGEISRAASESASTVGFAWQVAYLAGFAAYMIGLEGHSGATVGKRVLGLRVVPAKRRDGGPIGYQRAAIRNACRVYDLLIPLWPLAVLDTIVTLLSPRRQRTGDWFAGTVVVDVRE